MAATGTGVPPVAPQERPAIPDYPLVQPPASTPWWIFVGGVAALCLLAGLLFIVMERPTGSNRAPIMSAVVQKESTGSPKTGSSGMFSEEHQEAKEPTITIQDNSDEDLRLTMQDVNGITQSALIPANTDKEFTVPEGFYQAKIEVADNPSVLPMTGTLSVTNFHKYVHGFSIAKLGDRQSDNFFIGDEK